MGKKEWICDGRREGRQTKSLAPGRGRGYLEDWISLTAADRTTTRDGSLSRFRRGGAQSFVLRPSQGWWTGIPGRGRVGRHKIWVAEGRVPDGGVWEAKTTLSVCSRIEMKSEKDDVRQQSTAELNNSQVTTRKNAIRMKKDKSKMTDRRSGAQKKRLLATSANGTAVGLQTFISAHQHPSPTQNPKGLQP